MCNFTSGNDDRNIALLQTAARLRFALRNIFAHHAFISLQLPLVIGAVGEPFGNADLRIDLTGRHGDARLLTGGNDFLQAKLAVTENSDESNKHGHLHR